MLLPVAGETLRQVVRRPAAYFGDESTCPAEVELAIVPPAIEGLAARLAGAIAGKVDAARATMAHDGWDFLGAARVMGTSFVKRARSFEQKRKIIPRVAAKYMFLRQRLLETHRLFRAAYHEALARWRLGLREVEFPVGTWWMRVFHGARVDAVPALE